MTAATTQALTSRGTPPPAPPPALPAYPQPLPPDAVTFDWPPNDFAATAQDTLGDLGTGTDGFDAILSEALLALDGFSALLAALDSPLADISSAVGELGNVWEQDFGDTLATAILHGQPAFDSFALTLDAGINPTTGGGPSTPSAYTCPAGIPAVDWGAVVQGQKLAGTTGYYTNATQTDQTITAVEVEQGTPAIFSVAVNLPLVVHAGQAAVFTVEIDSSPGGIGATAGDYYGTVKVHLAGQDTPVETCVHVTVAVPATGPPPPPPGGGGGGNGGGAGCDYYDVGGGIVRICVG